MTLNKTINYIRVNIFILSVESGSWSKLTLNSTKFWSFLLKIFLKFCEACNIVCHFTVAAMKQLMLYTSLQPVFHLVFPFITLDCCLILYGNVTLNTCSYTLSVINLMDFCSNHSILPFMIQRIKTACKWNMGRCKAVIAKWAKTGQIMWITLLTWRMLICYI